MAQLCTNYERIKNRDKALEVVSGYGKAAGYKATYRMAALPYTSKEKCIWNKVLNTSDVWAKDRKVSGQGVCSVWHCHNIYMSACIFENPYTNPKVSPDSSCRSKTTVCASGGSLHQLLFSFLWQTYLGEQNALQEERLILTWFQRASGACDSTTSPYGASGEIETVKSAPKASPPPLTYFF